MHPDGYTKESPSGSQSVQYKTKPVIVCGDLNVAYQNIDLANPERNHNNPGFSDQERGKFGELLDAGFTDSFRYLHHDSREYSWWSYRFNARQKNIGWRIDYWLTSNELKDQIKTAAICKEIEGSDHCPVLLDLDVNVD